MRIYIQDNMLIFKGLSEQESAGVLEAIPTSLNVVEKEGKIIVQETPSNLYYLLRVFAKTYDIELI